MGELAKPAVCRTVAPSGPEGSSPSLPTKPTARILILKDYGDVLVGEVTGHPKQAQFRARAQQTSPIVCRWVDGRIETENTIYTVIEPNLIEEPCNELT